MPQNLHKIMDSWCDISITSCHVLCRIYRIDPIDTVPCIAIFQQGQARGRTRACSHSCDRCGPSLRNYTWLPVGQTSRSMQIVLLHAPDAATAVKPQGGCCNVTFGLHVSPTHYIRGSHIRSLFFSLIYYFTYKSI